MKHVTIYHNPKCSKSRETLALLKDRDIDPEVILYLNNPPSVTTLATLVKQLGFKSARELMRKKEDIYTELQLDNEKLTEAELLATMHSNPILIERPIVVVGNQARIGRPAENVVAIL